MNEIKSLNQQLDGNNDEIQSMIVELIEREEIAACTGNACGAKACGVN